MVAPSAISGFQAARLKISVMTTKIAQERPRALGQDARRHS
jgi:hypothetical protein